MRSHNGAKNAENGVFYKLTLRGKCDPMTVSSPLEMGKGRVATFPYLRVSVSPRALLKSGIIETLRHMSYKDRGRGCLAETEPLRASKMNGMACLNRCGKSSFFS